MGSELRAFKANAKVIFSLTHEQLDNRLRNGTLIEILYGVIYMVIHQDALASYEIGAISEAKMQEFNEMCLVQDIKTDYVNKEPGILDHVTA